MLNRRKWKFKIGDYISNYVFLIYDYLQEALMQFSEGIYGGVKSLPALYQYCVSQGGINVSSATL
jgi:hypothetical protein